MKQNSSVLRGIIKEGTWGFDYELRGEFFYKGILKVDRFSGISDEIPIIIPDKYIENIDFDKEIALLGSFRSRNVSVEGKSTLQLYFFTEGILDLDEVSNSNSIYLEGYICKTPVHRLTPFDREICDLLVAVNRNVKKSDYIPCIAWGRNANWAKNLKVGEKISLQGRIQSRRFSKPGDIEPNQRVAYEVSISKISII